MVRKSTYRADFKPRIIHHGIRHLTTKFQTDFEKQLFLGNWSFQRLFKLLLSYLAVSAHNFPLFTSMREQTPRTELYPTQGHERGFLSYGSPREVPGQDRDHGAGQSRGPQSTHSRQQVRSCGQGAVPAGLGPDSERWPLRRGARDTTSLLTSGVRSGGFFFNACLAPGSTGEFMAADP